MIIISGSGVSVSSQGLIKSKKIIVVIRIFMNYGSEGQRNKRGGEYSYIAKTLFASISIQWAIKSLNSVLDFEGFWTCVGFCEWANIPELVLYCKLCLQMVFLSVHITAWADVTFQVCFITHVKACPMHLVMGFLDNCWWRPLFQCQKSLSILSSYLCGTELKAINRTNWELC